MKKESYSISGVDTLSRSSGKLAPREVSLALAYECERIKQLLNQHGIGWVPYCFDCKVPLTWHYNDGVVFSCPSCGAKWKKDSSWGKKNESN
jgi:predicted RNA-binding Zn-ribbon protein involved in translation (DUF1610 family)